MKKGLKKLAASATTAAILAVPMAVATSGTGNGQEAKALNGFYYSRWDDDSHDWDDRWDNDYDDIYDWDDRWDNDWDDKYDFDDRWDNDWDDDRYDFDDYLDDHYDRWDD